MIDIEAARTFLEIVSAGSLSAAARSRGIAQSTLSRLLDRLEDQLGARLVERSSQAFRLTEAGHHFIEGARRLVRDAQTLSRRVGETSKSSHGTLRLSLSPALARRRLLEPTAAFLRDHPQVRVLMRLEDRVVDPVQEAVDVAVRVGAMGESRLVCQRLGTYEHVLVASPKYLRTAAPLRVPADLAHHPLIGIRGSRAVTRWGFMLGGQRTEVQVLPRVETNDAEVLVGMAVAGAGVTVLADYLAEEDLDSGRLVRALDRWRLPTAPIFAVYASASGLPRVAREWISAIKLALGASPQRRRRRS